MAMLIQGPATLDGTVRVSGSKNAALAHLAGAILSDGPVLLRNVPWVLDIDAMLECLAGLGVAAVRSGGEVVVRRLRRGVIVVPRAPAGRLRGSILLLAAVLARNGRVVVPFPGGCRLGDRPVDVHLRALRAMGAVIDIKAGVIHAEARRLSGAVIDAAGPYGSSVTGTCTAILAGVTAQGQTRIHSAALEPEVTDLGHFLCKMGARIAGLGTPEIIIDGVDQLTGAIHTVMPDRIEAGTWLIAGAAFGGSVTVGPIPGPLVASLLSALSDYGVRVCVRGDWVNVERVRLLRGGRLDLTPYPGLPTDLHPSLAALLALAGERSTVRDHVFPDRFQYLDPLARFGIDHRRRRDMAIFAGRPARLRAARVRAPDSRAAAAIALVGLAATGTTTLDGVRHLDRAYERFDHKLRLLGAAVLRTDRIA